MKRKILIFGIFITLLSLLTTGCEALGLAPTAEPTPLPTVTVSSGVIAEGRVVPKEYAALSLPVRGDIADIFVKESDTVTRGQILLNLADREQAKAALEQAKVAQINAQQQLDALNRTAAMVRAQAENDLTVAKTAVADAQKALDELDTQDFKDELENKQIAVQDAEDLLKDEQEILDKYLDLDKDNATRKAAQTAVDDALVALHNAQRDLILQQSQLDQTRAALDLATARLTEAQRVLDACKDGPDAEKLALAKAQVAAAEAQVVSAQAAVDSYDLKAPYDGTVMEIRNLEIGETILPGQTLMTIANTSSWYVETKDLTELDVVKIQIGQKVTIKSDALSALTMDGEVESISRVYSEKSNDVLYTVRVRLINPDSQLRWGMTVNVTFPD